MVVVDSLSSAVADGKTRSLVGAMEQLGLPTDKKVLLIVGAADEMLMRAGRNIEKLQINLASGIKVFDVLNADKIVVDRAALQQIKEIYGAAAVEEASA
jgi:large subunit ribosomal protein L4